MVNLDNLFSLIKDKKITAKTMSEATGISTGNISDWKKGRSYPSAPKLVDIAEYLECSVDYLLGRTDDPVLHKLKRERIIKTPAVNSPTKTQKPTLPLMGREAGPTQFIARQYFDMPASAGTGEWLGDDSSYSIINVPLTDSSRRADFIIRVSGDSMEPIFCDGDKLLILKTQSLDIGDIGVFVLNGESYVKKLGNSKLISFNPAYSDIQYDKDDTISVVGKVIGKV